MIKESSLFFRNLNEDENSKFCEHLKIINLYFILKIADQYQKKILHSAIFQARQNNREINIFDDEVNKNNNKYLDIVKDRNWPKLKKNNVLRNLRNKLASIYRNDGLTRKDLCNFEGKNEIILTGVNPLASLHSKSINSKISLIKITDYFPGANLDDIQLTLRQERSEYFDSKLFNQYLQIFFSIFRREGIEFLDEDYDEILNWHREFSLCISYYQNLLTNQPYSLPGQLWTSSAGILWNKLLAIEVRRQGGVVTGFDHAEGATLTTETIFPFIELQEVDVFVTHSKTFVSYLKDAAKDQLYNNICPTIIEVKR